MAGITGFNDAQITQLAQRHDDMANEIAREVTTLGQRVQQLKSSSSNLMTSALDSLYTEFSEAMTQQKDGAVPDLVKMAEDMRTALADQQAANQENQEEIQKLNQLLPQGGNPFASHLG